MKLLSLYPHYASYAHALLTQASPTPGFWDTYGMIVLYVGGFSLFGITFGLLSFKLSQKYQISRMNSQLEAVLDQLPVMRQTLLSDPEWFEVVQKELGSQKIVGIAQSVFIKRGLGILFYRLVNLALRVVGFELIDVERAVFVCLTDTHLHHLIYKQGRCTAKLSWQKSAIKSLKVSAVGVQDVAMRLDEIVNGFSNKISLETESERIKILFSHQIIQNPFGQNLSFVTDRAKAQNKLLALYGLTRLFKEGIKHWE